MVRAYVLSILGIAGFIVCVATLVCLRIVVERDDAIAISLARTLGSELYNHRAESFDALTKKVEHELAEERSFARRIEVWRNDVRLGGSEATAQLDAWKHATGCTTERVEGRKARVCAVRTEPDSTIVVASPVGPMLSALWPIALAIAGTAALAALAFSLASRRLVQRSLLPLRGFELRLADLPARNQTPVPSHWGAREIDQLAATFNALLARIEEGRERESRFVANAAHELRTPLTRLRGQIDLVLQTSLDGPEARRRLGLAARSCEQLSRATEALLAMARDELRLEDAVELADLTMSFAESFDPTQRSRIVVEVSAALVRGDDVLLALAARNLVENALQYSTGEVRVRTFDTEGQCTLEVLDHGPGIAHEEQQRVRLPFVRGESASSNVRGVGIGLALVEHVATLHGGTLQLNERPAGGLRAAIVLPPWHARTLEPAAR